MSKHPAIPEVLLGYSYADKLGFKYSSKSHLGCWSVPVLIALGFVAINYGGQPIGTGLGGIMFVMAIGCFAWFVYSQQNRKHKIPCGRCGQITSVVDTPMPKDELVGLFDGYGHEIRGRFTTSFQGLDGHIYVISKDADGGHCSMKQYNFMRLVQRWYACHDCKRCFRAEPRIYENIKSFTDEKEAETFKSQLTGKDNDDSETVDFLDKLADDHSEEA